MTEWDRFIGIAHLDGGRDRYGCDCWGLVRLVYAERLGIVLPSYAGDYATTHERAELTALIARGRVAGAWRAVDRAQAFDALVFRVGPHASHIALAVDVRHMLHVHARGASVIVPQADAMWRNRLTGIYRHEAMA